jgi:hypothetical protein
MMLYTDGCKVYYQVRIQRAIGFIHLIQGCRVRNFVRSWNGMEYSERRSYNGDDYGRSISWLIEEVNQANLMDNPSPPKAQNTIQRLRRFLWPASVMVALLLAVSAGAYAWFFLFHPCELNVVEEASALLFSQLDRYEDVYQVAISSSPQSVILPVSVLQQILMDTQQVAVPSCMQTAKGELLGYMRTIIRAFDAYAAQEPDESVRGLIKEAVTHLQNFDTELDAVKECAPYCIR